MSLISLLIALAAERYLSSSAWQFTHQYNHYFKLFNRLSAFGSPAKSLLANSIFLFAPVILCYFLLGLISDGLLHFIFSTIVLIGCFGCVRTRDTYKQYLMAAFRGEQTTCEMHHQQLQQEKKLPDMSFGQMLIWLNYRYYIALMLFFILFGATGALFYRLVCQINEGRSEAGGKVNSIESEDVVEVMQASKEDDVAELTEDNSTDTSNEQGVSDDGSHDNENDDSTDADVDRFNQRLLFWLDVIPVRIVAFGYMLVGHFSRAMPIWLESLFDLAKIPQQLLITVAQKSEDFMVDKEDCTAEPCLLVRLAKRCLLLCLAVIALLILTGVMT